MNKNNHGREKNTPEKEENTTLETEENSLAESASGNSDTTKENKSSEQNEEDSHTQPDLQKELDLQKDKYLRLFAEFDNYKKRTAKEVWEIRQTASMDVITSLLEVLDDIDRAEEQLQQNADKDKVLDGIQLIFNKLKKILEQKGLKSIETLNSEFDVEKDEAVSEIAVDDKKMKGKVVAEIQKGYTLNGKLIRFAKVVVGK